MFCKTLCIVQSSNMLYIWGISDCILGLRIRLFVFKGED